MEKENITLNVRNGKYSANDMERPELLSLADFEKNHIKRILDMVKWNKLEASRILDITRPTLYAKIEKYNLVQKLHKDTLISNCANNP